METPWRPGLRTCSDTDSVGQTRQSVGRGWGSRCWLHVPALPSRGREDGPGEALLGGFEQKKTWSIFCRLEAVTLD